MVHVAHSKDLPPGIIWAVDTVVVTGGGGNDGVGGGDGWWW